MVALCAFDELTAVQTPRDGAWNMIDKKFHKPATIGRWVMLVFEREQRFNGHTAAEAAEGLRRACVNVGA